MVINLNACTRCRTCYIACKKEHNILAHPRDNEHPYEFYRLRYVEWEWGLYPAVRRTFIPIACMQCEDPICAKFCPVHAITQRIDGILVIDKNICNGCGVCAAVCPYGALYITPEGKADACDFCAERLDRGLPPKCIETCMGRARTFGDLDDPDSDVSKLVASGKAKPLLLDGVKRTMVYYIPSMNEFHWDELGHSEDFSRFLNKRKKDLPPIKGVI